MLPTDLSYRDAGLLVWMFEYGHLLRWSGAAWEWGPGDPGSGYISDFVAAPTGPGWQLCDGTATDYLVVTPVPAAVSFTTPDEVSQTVYHVSASAYSGTVDAPVAPGLTGSTGDDSASVEVQAGTGTTVAAHAHTHPVGSLAVDDTAQPRRLGVLKYFRR